ncbi:MAG TPA: DUF3459 domain-containing protein, partial [Dyadobacter sp.]|nr:DUF3459 domain-containing protein [Dyadobacter sp.]
GLQWELADQGDHKTMLAYYKHFIAIRKSTDALRHLNRDGARVLQVDTESQTLVLIRTHNEEQVLCLMNFSDQSQTLSVDHETDSWKKLLASSDAEWGGSAEMSSEISNLSNLSIPAESITLYTNKL